MQNAQELQDASKGSLGASPQFLLAYEGMFNVVMAVLEFYEVRPGDAGGHRATAIGRVAADLALPPAKQGLLQRDQLLWPGVHQHRQGGPRRTPAPPLRH